MSLLGETKEDLIKALWEVHVLPFIESPPETDSEREAALLAALRHHRKEAEDAMRGVCGSEAGSDRRVALANAVENGRIVLSLLVGHAASWLQEATEWTFLPWDTDSSDPLERRRSMVWALRTETSPYFSAALDPTCILMPRQLANELREALRALDYGAVLPMLAPVGPSSDWFLLKARMRAVEHVCFLVGQGVSVTKARKRVAAALKIPSDTLRDWQGDMKEDFSAKHQMKLAQKAGELQVLLTDNPDFGKSPGETIDIDAEHFLAGINAEPLSEFGRQYRNRKSRPSWGTPAVDDERKESTQ